MGAWARTFSSLLRLSLSCLGSWLLFPWCRRWGPHTAPSSLLFSSAHSLHCFMGFRCSTSDSKPSWSGNFVLQKLNPVLPALRLRTSIPPASWSELLDQSGKTLPILKQLQQRRKHECIGRGRTCAETINVYAMRIEAE